MYTHIDGDTKIIRICKSILQAFYNNGSGKDAMTTPTKAYNECGGWDDPDTTFE